MFTYLAHFFTDPQSLRQYLVASTVTGLMLIDSWDTALSRSMCLPEIDLSAFQTL